MDPRESKRTVRAIKDAVAAGQLEAAMEAVDAGLARSASDLKLQAWKARILMLSGHAEEARRHAEDALARHGASPDLHELLARLYQRREDIERALAHAEAARAAGLDEARHAKLRASLATSAREPGEQLQWLERQHEAGGGSAKFLLVLARARGREGNRAGEIAAIEEALALEPHNAPALAALARCAAAMGDAGRASQAADRLESLVPADAAQAAQFYQLLRDLGRTEAARALARRALAAGQGSPELEQLLAAEPVQDELAAEALAWARGLPADASEEDVARALTLFVTHGQTVPPQLEERAFGAGRPPGPLSGTDWLRNAPANALLRRPVLTYAPAEDEVVASPKGSSDVLALVFTGVADRLMLRLPSLDRYFAVLDIDALYLRDMRRMLFLQGIASVAPTLDATLARLRERVAASGARRLVAVGTSAGCFAAMRYGMALGAQGIVCFSPVSCLRPGFDPADTRAPLLARKLHALPPEEQDILPFVQANGGRSAIHVVYGDAMPTDALHARHLAGAPGVHMHPIAGFDEHLSVLAMVRDATLLPFLRETLLAPGAPSDANHA